MNGYCRDYVNKFKKSDDSFEVLISNETYFRDKFTQFLFSPKGAIFQVFLNPYIDQYYSITSKFTAKFLVF